MATIAEWENEIGKRRLDKLREIAGALKTLRAWEFFSKEFSDMGLGVILAAVEHQVYRKEQSEKAQQEAG